MLKSTGETAKWNDWEYVFLRKNILRTSANLKILINPWNVRAFSDFSKVASESLKIFVIHWIHLDFFEIIKVTSESLKISVIHWIHPDFLKSLKSPVKVWKYLSILEFPCFFWNQCNHQEKLEKTCQTLNFLDFCWKSQVPTNSGELRRTPTKKLKFAGVRRNS